jgi:glutamine transport system permease protein
MKKIVKILIVGVLSLLAFLVTSNNVNAAQTPNYIITTDATYPPFDFQDKNNQYTGIDQEILKTIAKRQGFTYTLKPMSF